MPNPSSLSTITMTIKRQFFAEILALPPRKKIEYREMKPYWQTRLKAVMNRRFKLRLLNGMIPAVAAATVVVERIVQNKKKTKQYELYLAQVLELIPPLLNVTT